jgi:hypothetical protein
MSAACVMLVLAACGGGGDGSAPLGTNGSLTGEEDPALALTPGATDADAPAFGAGAPAATDANALARHFRADVRATSDYIWEQALTKIAASLWDDATLGQNAESSLSSAKLDFDHATTGYARRIRTASRELRAFLRRNPDAGNEAAADAAAADFAAKVANLLRLARDRADLLASDIDTDLFATEDDYRTFVTIKFLGLYRVLDEQLDGYVTEFEQALAAIAGA